MLKLLIADDEPMALISAAYAFTGNGGLFDPPVKTSDSYEALSILKNRRIDLCVIDIRMPGLTGLEIMEECQKVKIKTKFVVLSGYSDFSYAQKAMSHGAIDYCLKPIDDDDAAGVAEKAGKIILEERKKSDGAILSQISNRPDYYGIKAGESYRVMVSGAEGRIPGESFFMEDRIISIAEVSCESPPECCAVTVTAEKIQQAVQTAMHTSLALIIKGECFSSAYINESFLRLINEVEANATGDITLGALAKKYALNYNYCSELFRKTTGKSFVEFLTEKRMERASGLLLHSGMSVARIAMEAGYSDYHYFANVFKNYFGVTPGEFRKRAGEQQ